MLVQYEPWVYRGEIPEGIEGIKTGDLWGVKILEGTFGGTTISFNSVDFVEETEGNNLQLDYTVVYPPEGKDKEYCSGEEFNNVLQHIIIDVINKAAELYENRNSNTSEPSQQ